MSSTTVSEFTNVSELLESLGDISPSRVLLKPPPSRATEADLLDSLTRRGRLCELVDGVLVEKPMGAEESLLTGWLILNLSAHILQTDAGCIMTESGMVRLSPAIVRAPDISFFRWTTLPDRTFPRDKISQIAPDLAVEVLSESNTIAEMDRKICEYFLADTEQVWLVDPVKRTIVVYTTPQNAVTLTEADILDGGSVLPGLNLPISRIFGPVIQAPKRSRRKKS